MVSLRPLAALPVVGVIADGRTYRHLLYLFIAFPLWFVYSMLASAGLVLGIVFSVVLVGIGILVVCVVASRLFAGFERWLANRLLGTELAAPDDVATDVTGAVESVRAYLAAPSTWRGLGFVSLKFWLTAAAFAPLFLLASALPLVSAPVRYPYETSFGEVNGEPVVWAVDTAPEAALATGLGVGGVLVGLHLTNLIAGGARLMAVALLGEEAGSQDGGSVGGGEPDDGDRVTVDRDATDRNDVAEPDDGESDDVDESGDAGGPAADGFEFGDAPESPDGGDDRTERD